MLMWVGAMPAEGIYVVLGRLGTAYWFGFIFILAPIVGLFETPKTLPASIHESMEKKSE
jgi:ubiquinol-cytochrome c reductase cytochrome b subunit